MKILKPSDTKPALRTAPQTDVKASPINDEDLFSGPELDVVRRIGELIVSRIGEVVREEIQGALGKGTISRLQQKPTPEEVRWRRFCELNEQLHEMAAEDPGRADVQAQIDAMEKEMEAENLGHESVHFAHEVFETFKKRKLTRIVEKLTITPESEQRAMFEQEVQDSLAAFNRLRAALPKKRHYFLG